MNELETLNDKVLEQIKFIDKDCELSNPLLVAPNTKGKTLYLGQETNGWFSSHNKFTSARELEKEYDNFFIKAKMRNTLFWKFIRRVTGVNDVANLGDITWGNTFICGNKDCKGTPSLSNEIKNVSVNYLVNLVNILEIEKIIAVVGPKNPYYTVLNELISSLGWELTDCPQKSNPYVYSDNKKLFYTYHPMYLQRSKNFNKTLNEAKNFVKKR